MSRGRFASTSASNPSHDGSAGLRPAATVGVVVTTYNHASFLGEALASVCTQRRPLDGIVVVDDGSMDDPAAVVARYSGVQLIRQDHRGLSAARNRGLAELRTTYVLFLDADDCLTPDAIERAVACAERNPGCGLVYGGHVHMDAVGNALDGRYSPPGRDPYLSLLRGNFIAMHGAVMYRREALLALGGFDETLRRCEDYDVYLRMAKRYTVAGVPDRIAAYRLHDGNMSTDRRAMLRTALQVHRRYEPGPDQPDARAAWNQGRRNWRRYYAEEILASRYRSRRNGGSLARSLPPLWDAVRADPTLLVEKATRRMGGLVRTMLPSAVRRRLCPAAEIPPVGRVRFGDLRRTAPVSRDFGFDRGLPIDRYYIDRFLERHAFAIGGRVLEVGDDSYTRAFGGTRVSHSDVLHVHAGNPRATFVGDLTDASVLPADTFDCIILTQTLHLIYDVRMAVARLHRALAPGGVVLVTGPGITQIDRGEWRDSWCWSFTTTSLRRLFSEAFGADAVSVEHFGNVLSATAFLQGLAVEEVGTHELDVWDDQYPVIIGVRARKTAQS